MGNATDSRNIWLLLLAYVFAAPFIPLTGISIKWQEVSLMDWQRIFEAGVLLICMALALTSPRPIRPPPLFLAWFALFTLGGLSALLVAEHTVFSLLEWSWLLMITILAGYIHGLGINNREKLDRTILTVVLASAFGYLWWFWKLNAFIYFTPLPEGVVRVVDFPGFANIRFFSDFQSFLLLLLPAAIQRIVPRGPVKIATELFVGLFFALALIVGSRSLLVAHILMHALMLTLLGKRYWPFLRSQMLFWGLGLFYFLVLTKLIPILMGGHSGSLVASTIMRFDSSFRIDLWIQAWDIIKQHPWLGIGPLHYANFPNAIASSPHNFFLQIAAEWGVPAFLLFSLLLGRVIHLNIKTLKQIPNLRLDNIPLGMVCVSIAVVLQALVASSPLNYPVGQVVALICFAYPMQENQAGQMHQTRRGGASMSLIGVFAMMMVIGSLTTLQSIKERNLCFYYNPWPTKQFAPRFWQQGWLIGPCGEGKALFNQFPSHGLH